MKKKYILELILEAIPRDEWVKANEIADKLGLTTRAVGSIIGYNLLHQFIKRKKSPDSSDRTFLYKRIN